MQPIPVKFRPVPKARVWGGHTLKPWFHETDPQPIGEYWVLSDHAEGPSIITGGAFDGMALGNLLTTYPAAYLGNSPQPRFPLLIKFLEAAQNLSVQVHPDDVYGLAHAGDYGKTEAWYVLRAEESKSVVYGHKFATRAEMAAAIDAHTLVDGLEFRPIEADDVVFVPSGTLHALLAGTTVLEVQQTSDVTYRVYDWDRVGTDGKPRSLHIAQSLAVTRFAPTPTPTPVPALATSASVTLRRLATAEGWVLERLVECGYFTIDRLAFTRAAHATLSRGESGNPDVLIVIDGAVDLHYAVDGEAAKMPLQRGETVLIPATLMEYTVVSSSQYDAQILRVFYPSTGN